MCLRYLSCARLVPEEVRKGNEIPQSWSCRGLWAVVSCQESNSGPLEEQWVMFCCWAVSLAFVPLVIDVFKLEIAFSWFLDLHNNVKGAVWWNKGRKISHFARWHLVPPVLRAYWSLVTSKRTKKWMDSSCSSDSATVTVPQENKNKNKSLIAICVASVLNWDRITCLTTQNNSQCLFVVNKSLAPKGSQAVARVL